ncbi:hypothetical protein [Spirillospora sp. NBC_01491]|uniref:hypothetical protein n=1 Tax=Spirillospora sp. NBC_01491 TaxID=2976007 RepID=UPI002E322AB6|nr:hypothetical protein [Spirillospora sp. NBC_01491]
MATKKNAANSSAGSRPTGPQAAANAVAPVTDGSRPAGAAGDVWDALTATPGATASAIGTAAGVSRATVGRTLTNLERDGRATRTPGGRDGGKRLPDTWHALVTVPGTATGTDVVSEPDAAPTGHAPDTSADRVEPDEAPGGTVATDDTTSAGADTSDVPPADEGDGMDVAAVAEARDALTAMSAAVTAALDALTGGNGEAALTAVEAVYGGSGKARRLVRTAALGRPRTASGQARSQPGEMRAKVAAHLTAYPGTEFTPHEIGKVIGHSAGAVSNALDRLTESGAAELVCDRPRRFTTVSPTAGAVRPMASAAR